MTDKSSPSPSDVSREPSTSEADLDTALWPGAQGVTGQAARSSITKGTPRISARDRIRIERERTARRRRIRRALAVGAGVLVLSGATVVGITIKSHQGRHAHVPPAPFGYLGPYAPVTINADNSVTMARPGVTAPVIDVYEDFQCPACRAFEGSDGAVIQQLAEQGKARVVYYPFTVYSGQPQQANSIRAWAAARCALPGRWVKYHNELYANQPAQTVSGGFQVSQLIRLGKDAGITSPAFAQCVRSQQYAVEDAPFSDQILNAGISTMPDLTLDGKVLGSGLTPSALRKQILAASVKPKETAPKPALREGQAGIPERRPN
jgi:protein-disulfide isomerase